MTKIKVFFQNKLNILIVSIVAVVVIAVPLTITLMNKNKPVEVAQAPSSEPTSSISKPKVNVPEIKIDKPVSSEVSSETSSKEVTLKVEGEVSSKATSSKSQIKIDGNTPAKPAVSSKPTPPPVSSKPTPPTHETEPVTPPVNPDGPQHGDTREINCETKYFHVGFNGYISKPEWENWGKYPQAKEIDLGGGYSKVDTSFLKEGEKQYIESIGQYIVWCEVQDTWIVEKSYNYHSHTGNDHGQPH